jgi:hypothetical protein
MTRIVPREGSGRSPSRLVPRCRELALTDLGRPGQCILPAGHEGTEHTRDVARLSRLGHYGIVSAYHLLMLFPPTSEN